MIRALCFLLLLATSAGCSTSAKDQPLSDAENAKAALLELMKTNPNPFHGADPARLAEIKVKAIDTNKYVWDAFTFDTALKIYNADVGGSAFMNSYTGRFVVCSDGKWVAKKPQVAYFDR
jgi:hypothetical protein